MKIFVSGTFDILHAGHIQFFEDAKRLGSELVVSFCSAENLMIYKGRKASMPDDNKKTLLESIRYIDRVYKGTDDGGIWDFVPAFINEEPDVLVITTDDKHREEKEQFCDEHDAILVVLEKNSRCTPTSTTEIRQNLCEKQ
jgi:cytidyltransferase-like protein